MGKRKKATTTKQAVQHLEIHRLSKQLARYEAAQDTRRTAGWYTPMGGPNADIKQAWRWLVRRHQDLVDNEPWAKKAVGVLQNNWVGDGIISTPVASSKRYATAWDDWATGTHCDFYGRHNLWGLQSLVARTTAARGACLIRKRAEPKLQSDHGLVPLQIQVMEPDLLDFEKDNGVNIFFGIQIDQFGRVEGYHVRDHHPGENLNTYQRGVSQFVSKDDCLLHFETLRPGQLIGVPFGVAAILSLRDIGDTRSAQMMKDKIAASFCAFVTDADGDSTDLSGGEIIDTIKPGAVEILPPGKSIVFAQPPSSGDYVQTERAYLYSVAAAFEIPFWCLTGILDSVNFSSMKGDYIEFSRRLASLRYNVTIPQLCAPICKWHDDAARMIGLLRGPMRWVHTPPRREMIDPSKEIPAIIEAIRAGLMSLQETQRSYGYIPEAVIQELKEDKERAEAAGLNLSVFMHEEPPTVTEPDPVADTNS
jgi:lambda family phage portal protein